MVPYAAYAGALCLDGPTLTNLELLESSAGSSEGSLLACLDTCASAGLPTSCHSTPLALHNIEMMRALASWVPHQSTLQNDFLAGAAMWCGIGTAHSP